MPLMKKALCVLAIRVMQKYQRISRLVVFSSNVARLKLMHFLLTAWMQNSKEIYILYAKSNNMYNKFVLLE